MKLKKKYSFCNLRFLQDLHYRPQISATASPGSTSVNTDTDFERAWCPRLHWSSDADATPALMGRRRKPFVKFFFRRVSFCVGRRLGRTAPHTNVAADITTTLAVCASSPSRGITKDSSSPRSGNIFVFCCVPPCHSVTLLRCSSQMARPASFDPYWRGPLHSRGAAAAEWGRVASLGSVGSLVRRLAWELGTTSKTFSRSWLCPVGMPYFYRLCLYPYVKLRLGHYKLVFLELC